MSPPASSAASRRHEPVTLLDQAEAAVDIVQSFNERKPSIKVTPNGSAAVGLLARHFRKAQPDALKLLVSSREDRETARSALKKRLKATVEADKRIAFESRYDMWHYIVLQLKPKWLDGTTTVAKTDRIEIRRPAPTSLLLYLLYDVAAAVERLPDGPEPLRCALSVLYIFSLLVSPRTPTSDARHVELKFSRSSWSDTFDQHLRADDAHRERYKKVRALLRDETLKAGEELDGWARWLVESTEHALRDGQDEDERTVDERVDIVVDGMTAFLQKVYHLIIGPFEPGARTTSSPVAAPGRPHLVRRRGGGQTQCVPQ
ncbi:hypothetical protein JCM3775_006008 [Rhodotorula graminis]